MQLYIFILICAVLLAALGNARARIRKMSTALQYAAAAAVALDRETDKWKEFVLTLVAHQQNKKGTVA